MIYLYSVSSLVILDNANADSTYTNHNIGFSSKIGVTLLGVTHCIDDVYFMLAALNC